jgi:hypothetical protein
LVALLLAGVTKDAIAVLDGGGHMKHEIKETCAHAGGCDATTTQDPVFLDTIEHENWFRMGGGKYGTPRYLCPSHSVKQRAEVQQIGEALYGKR